MRDWLEARVVVVVAGTQMATVAVMFGAAALSCWLPVLVVAVLLVAAMCAVCEVGYRLLLRAVTAVLERRGEGGGGA